MNNEKRANEKAVCDECVELQNKVDHYMQLSHLANKKVIDLMDSAMKFERLAIEKHNEGYQLKQENKANREVNRNLANANHDYKIENEKLKELLNKDDMHLLHNYFRGVVSYGNQDTIQAKEDYELYTITHKLKNYSTGKTIGENNE